MTLELAKTINQKLIDAGAKHVLMVGGCVRDQLLNIDPKDYDLECYGLSFDKIMKALEPLPLKLVGFDFVVINVKNQVEISVPRREKKTGMGHRDYFVEPDPDMTIKEACSRRDFTINSMAIDMNSGNTYDYYGGAKDLKNKVLSATSEAYQEDALRVLRAMQFAARFDMTMDDKTIQMSKKMANEFDELPMERLYIEWNKWALKGKYLDKGLKILEATQWLTLFPDLCGIYEVPQDPEYHPEGNAWTHTCHVVQAAYHIAEREKLCDPEKLILIFAALCHDLGKAKTTHLNDKNRWVSPGHDVAGIPLTESFLGQICVSPDVINIIRPLVAEHMVHVYSGSPNNRMVRRLANRLGNANIKQLSMVVEADYSGRPPIAPHNPFVVWEETAKSDSIYLNRPTPILMGKHLIPLGIKPGKAMGDILKAAFTAQLDSEFNDLDGALNWAKPMIEKYLIENPLKTAEIIFMDTSKEREEVLLKIFPTALVKNSAEAMITAIASFDIINHLFLEYEMDDKIKTGMDVVDWMIQKLPRIGHITIHAMNVPKAMEMEDKLKQSGYKVIRLPWTKFSRSLDLL